MDEILKLLVAYRPEVLADPLLALVVLADNLSDEDNPLAEASAQAIRYWCAVRQGLRDRDDTTDEWFGRVMDRYGPATQIHRSLEGDLTCTLKDRILNYWTRADFVQAFIPTIIQDQPIFTVIITECGWDGIRFLNHDTLRHVDTLTLDFRSSTQIFSLGIVRAMETLELPALKRLMVHAQNSESTGLKGMAAVAVMDAVTKKKLPRGIEFWWNGART